MLSSQTADSAPWSSTESESLRAAQSCSEPGEPVVPAPEVPALFITEEEEEEEGEKRRRWGDENNKDTRTKSYGSSGSVASEGRGEHRPWRDGKA